MRVVALAGGTGGAKLAHGLQAVLPPGDLTVIVNTGDDTERHGLLVMPDHDAVMYMLADRFDFERGWGQLDETWTVMDELAGYGEEAWFRLGDKDFATHIARTARISEGRALTSVVLSLQRALGIRTAILPMADEPVRTQVRTDDGWLDFQEYFVHLQQGPEVRDVRFKGDTAPTARVVAALDAADFIVIGPSNPIVSIGPILAGPIQRGRGGRGQAGCPGGGRQPDRGGRGIEGAGRSDAALARSRVERPGSSRIYQGSPRPSWSTRSTRPRAPTSRPSASRPW